MNQSYLEDSILLQSFGFYTRSIILKILKFTNSNWSKSVINKQQWSNRRKQLIALNIGMSIIVQKRASE